LGPWIPKEGVTRPLPLGKLTASEKKRIIAKIKIIKKQRKNEI